MFRGALVLAIFATATPSFADAPIYRGFDVYRSDRVTAEQIQAKAGPLIDSYLHLRAEGSKSAKMAERLKKDVEERVRKIGGLAYVGLYYAEFISSAERTCFLTFDVVDEKDANARMPFRPAP